MNYLIGDGFQAVLQVVHLRLQRLCLPSLKVEIASQILIPLFDALVILFTLIAEHKLTRHLLVRLKEVLFLNNDSL